MGLYLRVQSLLTLEGNEWTDSIFNFYSKASGLKKVHISPISTLAN